MPRISVHDVLTDPDLITKFVVRRRKEIVDDFGVGSTSDQVFPNITGVVTMGDPNDISNGDAYRSNARSLTVVTNFPLYGVVKGYQPDLIIWKGDSYLVNHITPYPEYGPGFYEVSCSSMAHQDQALLPNHFGQSLAFNSVQSSGFVAFL